MSAVEMCHNIGWFHEQIGQILSRCCWPSQTIGSVSMDSAHDRSKIFRKALQSWRESVLLYRNWVSSLTAGGSQTHVTLAPGDLPPS